MKKLIFCILKVTDDLSTDYGSASGFTSGSVNQRYGSEDPHPDPYQNVTDPEHCFLVMKTYCHELNDKICA
jgi:hypothetical protein